MCELKLSVVSSAPSRPPLVSSARPCHHRPPGSRTRRAQRTHPRALGDQPFLQSAILARVARRLRALLPAPPIPTAAAAEENGGGGGGARDDDESSATAVAAATSAAPADDGGKAAAAAAPPPSFPCIFEEEPEATAAALEAAPASPDRGGARPVAVAMAPPPPPSASHARVVAMNFQATSVCFTAASEALFGVSWGWHRKWHASQQSAGAASYVLLNAADEAVGFNRRGAPTTLLHHYIEVPGKKNATATRRCAAPRDRAWARIYAAPRRRGGGDEGTAGGGAGVCDVRRSVR